MLKGIAPAWWFARGGRRRSSEVSWGALRGKRAIGRGGWAFLDGLRGLLALQIVLVHVKQFTAVPRWFDLLRGITGSLRLS